MRTGAFTRPATVLLALATVLAWPAPAQADGEDDGVILLPPGHSAADQYRESLPGVTGDRLNNGGGDRTAEKVIGEKNAEALREAGGEDVAELVVSGAPERRSDRSERERVEKESEQSGGSGGGEIASAATGISSAGEGGLGPLLPILVLTAIVGFIGIAVGRRRRRS